MARLLMFVALVMVLAACGMNGPTATPSPAATLVPLPEGLSGIPAANVEFTAEVRPVSPPDELEVGSAVDYNLGHCGLGTPIDIDGSLWNPVGSAAALTEPQRDELINATAVSVVLISEELMQLETPAGAVLTLTRHDGPRRYFLCD